MNRWQIAKQLAYLLRLSGIFATGSAFAASVSVDSFLASGLTFPLAAVETLPADHELEYPERLEVARFRISIAADVLTEAKLATYLGSGGTLTGDKTLEQTAKDTLAYLNEGKLRDSTEAMQGVVRRTGDQRLVTAPRGQHSVADLEVEVFNATEARRYHTARLLAATSPGSGQISVTWTNPPQRFDWWKNLVRRSAAGGAAPTTPSEGVADVTLIGGDKGSSASASSLPAGTYQVSHFVLLDENVEPPASQTNYALSGSKQVVVA